MGKELFIEDTRDYEAAWLRLNMTIQNPDLLIAHIKALCDRWQITEFALFGSVLRDDFNPTSDIDVLITFAPNVRKGLLTLARIKHELEELFGREVDISTKKSIEQSQNTSRSQAILRSAQVIYVA
ncbi:nucleotidyltransferase family protein [Egbenema bharatensis]|uniref:nucleotidyltransferase family protein n=1 Tax=Egbenema bharatensis TaxID=3463334 RepID=UPI003A8A2F70